MVRKDIYLKKTGKEFNEHKDRIPYGAKEEITTGISFLPKLMNNFPGDVIFKRVEYAI